MIAGQAYKWLISSMGAHVYFKVCFLVEELAASCQITLVSLPRLARAPERGCVSRAWICEPLDYTVTPSVVAGTCIGSWRGQTLDSVLGFGLYGPHQGIDLSAESNLAIASRSTTARI
jgi:hypothetical protein